MKHNRKKNEKKNTQKNSRNCLKKNGSVVGPPQSGKHKVRIERITKKKGKKAYECAGLKCTASSSSKMNRKNQNKTVEGYA